MKIKKISAKNANGLPAGIGLGLLASFVITLLGAVGITQLVVTEEMEENSMGYGIMGVLLLASILGSWLAANRTKRMRLQVCLLAGAGYFLGLLAITALFFGGQYQGIGAAGITILLGSSLMAFFPGFGKRKIKVKNRAYR